MKREEALNRESKKLIIRNTKETKEESKKRRGEMNDKNKIRSQYRKDFSSDLKRIRGDANVSVLQYFDEEENLEEQEQHIKHSHTINSIPPLITSSSSNTNSSCGQGDDDRSTVKGLESGSKVYDKIAAGFEARENFFLSLPSCDEAFLPSSMDNSNSSCTDSSAALLDNVTANDLKIFTTAATVITNEKDNRISSITINEDLKKENHAHFNTNININTNMNTIANVKMNENEGSRTQSYVNWDDVFQMVNCLYAFNDFLQFQMPIKLDGVIDRIARVTLMINDNHNDNDNDRKNEINDAVKVKESKNQISNLPSDSIPANNLKKDKITEKNIHIESTSSTPLVSESSSTLKLSNTDQEDEWDERDYKKTKFSNDYATNNYGFDKGIAREDEDDKGNIENNLIEILRAQSDLDRMHLCLLNSLTGDIHSLLDLDETDKGSAVRFPLNQVHSLYLYLNIYLYL